MDPVHFLFTGKGNVRYMNGSKVMETLKRELAQFDGNASFSHLLALWTDKGALVLALEQIDNYTIVPLEVPVPRGVSQLDQLLVSSTLPIRFLDVRFLHDTIQVFMQSIQQESDQLLGIVLLVTNKLRGESLECLFELSRGVRGGWRGVRPDPSKESTKAFCNSSVHPKGVIRVEFCFEYSCYRCGFECFIDLTPSPLNVQTKYWQSSLVCAKHWRAEFMKQVFPLQ